MQKRICPICFGRWYSSDSSHVWKCETCGHDIPVPKDGDEIAGCNGNPILELQRTNEAHEKI